MSPEKPRIAGELRLRVTSSGDLRLSRADRTFANKWSAILNSRVHFYPFKILSSSIWETEGRSIYSGRLGQSSGDLGLDIGVKFFLHLYWLFSWICKKCLGSILCILKIITPVIPLAPKFITTPTFMPLQTICPSKSGPVTTAPLYRVIVLVHKHYTFKLLNSTTL